MQLGIATQMFVLKVKITAAKIENQLLHYFSFLWPFVTKRSIPVAYVNAFSWIATNGCVFKVKVNVAKSEIVLYSIS